MLSLFFCMNPVLFYINGVLPDGKYLLGQGIWQFPVRLTRALLTCDRPPTQGTLTLTLEVGGELTLFAFVVAAGGVKQASALDFGFTLPAGVAVRWKASFTDAPENAAAAVSVSMEVETASTRPQPVLQVVWAKGRARLPAFNYDSASHTFSRVPGFNQARIDDGGGQQLTVSIGGDTALQVVGSAVQVAEFDEGLGPGPDSEWLEFQVEGQAIARLSGDGVLRVPGLVETAPPILTPEYDAYFRRFEFYNEGALTAVLDGNGFTAKAVKEIAI
jgi:hypothetical protein